MAVPQAVPYKESDDGNPSFVDVAYEDFTPYVMPTTGKRKRRKQCSGFQRDEYEYPTDTSSDEDENDDSGYGAQPQENDIGDLQFDPQDY